MTRSRDRKERMERTREKQSIFGNYFQENDFSHCGKIRLCGYLEMIRNEGVHNLSRKATPIIVGLTYFQLKPKNDIILK